MPGRAVKEEADIPSSPQSEKRYAYLLYRIRKRKEESKVRSMAGQVVFGVICVITAAKIFLQWLLSHFL